MADLNPNKYHDFVKRFLSSIILGVIACFVLLYPMFYGNTFEHLIGPGIIIGIFCVISLYEWGKLFRKKNIGIYFLFLLYILLGFYAFTILTLNAYQQYYGVTLKIILIVITSDVAAYFMGRLFGGMKPFPSISPGKTISGYIGGLIFGLIVGVGMHYVMPPNMHIILMILIILAGQAGDLFQSYIKRLSNVKDSGHILPGHGGILDRFDSILAAFIIAQLWILLF